MNIPVQIITLAPESAPVQELLKQLVKQGIAANTSLAVDGQKEMPSLLPEESINQTQSLKIRLIELSPSEIGCYLSHLRLIKKAYAENIPRLCILEDDVLIENSFKQVLSKIKELPNEIEFVRLMGLKLHKRKILSPLGDSHKLTRPVKGLCGTQGYVINRKGMELVLACGNTISEPIDKFFDHYWDIPLRCYCVEPHLIWERPRTPSSITRGNASKSLLKRIRRHQIKLTRSFRRRIYILRQITDFTPASKPTEKPGKTDRIH